MLITIRFRGRRFRVACEPVGFFRRGLGLMFRTRETSNLLFIFDRPSKVAITSWFVFFPFVAVWLDSHYQVTEARLILPFTLSVSPRVPSRYLLELPMRSRNSRITGFLVGK